MPRLLSPRWWPNRSPTSYHACPQTQLARVATPHLKAAPQLNPALDCGGLSASRQWQDRPARSAFALLAIYGLRPSEALGLSWSDIHPAPAAADLAARLSRPTCRPSLTGTGCSGRWNPRTDAGMHEQVFGDLRGARRSGVLISITVRHGNRMPAAGAAVVARTR
jgi:integrase